MHDEQPVEGEYQAPAVPAAPGKKAGRRAGGLGTIAAGLGVLALKFKVLLALLLNFKFVLIGAKLFAVSWTFILSLLFYIAAFGWRIGVVLVLLIGAHELGHYFAYRAYGLPVRAPVFVPFLGAYTAGAIAPDLEADAYIALAGPLTGFVLAGACFALGSALTIAFGWPAPTSAPS
jgi:Zn-dependent protease